MNKIVSFAICFLVVLIAGKNSACAALDEPRIDEVFGLHALTEGLEKEQTEVTGLLPDEGAYDAESALSRLLEAMAYALKKQLHEQLAFFGRLCGITIVAALADAVTDSRAARECVSLAACCAAAGIVAGDWSAGIQQANALLIRLSDYSRAALPVVYTAAAAAGAAGSAPMKYAASCFAIEVMLTVSQRLLLPAISAYLSLSLCECLCQNGVVSAVQRMLHFVATSGMGLLTAAFCSYVSLIGLVAGSTDAAAVKAARSALGALLPVVGGILADSASAILSAAAVVRNTAGVFAMIAVCSLCMGPFLLLFLKMMLLRAAACFAEVLPDGRFSRLLGQLASVFGMQLGLVGCGMIMLLFSLASGLRAVTGL